MTINHDPEMEPRDPAEGDLELFRDLDSGDRVTFFEWPVEPLTVLGPVEDEAAGECVKVESKGDESYIYELDGRLWHYSEGVDAENNPYPVQNLSRVETAEI